MKPKCENDCPFCVAEKTARKHPGESCPNLPISWRLRKGQGGRKKRISTQGYACPNQKCQYYRIVDEQIHALIGYGSHGKGESIQDIYCQCCHRKFSARRNTVLYRLARRTWGLGQYPEVLVDHIEWWRAYYHFSRSHESLRIEYATPVQRKGNQMPQKYPRMTPKMAAGLTDRRWTEKEVIIYPIYG